MFDYLITGVLAFATVATLSTTDFTKWISNAETARLKVSSHAVETAFTSYYVQRGTPPGSLDDLIAAGKLPERDSNNYEGLDQAFQQIARQAAIETNM